MLEGFDFGVGMLLPFARPRRHASAACLINTIGPVWDGNEVWLITAGGAMFAAFPEWYATLFSRLLPAAAAHPGGADRAQRRDRVARQDRRRPLAARAGTGRSSSARACPRCCGASRSRTSCAASRSTPTTSTPATFFDLLNPFALLGGADHAAAVPLHGAVFLALKTDGDDPGTAPARSPVGSAWSPRSLVAGSWSGRRSHSAPGRGRSRVRRRRSRWSSSSSPRGRPGRRAFIATAVAIVAAVVACSGRCTPT